MATKKSFTSSLDLGLIQIKVRLKEVAVSNPTALRWMSKKYLSNTYCAFEWLVFTLMNLRGKTLQM